MDSRGIPPETSNFYCLPGRAGGFPILLVQGDPRWYGILEVAKIVCIRSGTVQRVKRKMVDLSARPTAA
jgi:hypothetical protein